MKRKRFSEERIIKILQAHEAGVLASPVIIGPLAMLGFLDIGGTDERQAIYRRTDHSDIT